MEDLRKLALAQHLHIDLDWIEDEIEVSGRDDCAFEAEGGEYLVLTGSEADGRWEEALNRYIESCLGMSDDVRGCFDEDAWKSDAKLDGRGHSLSLYDGDEHEQKVDETDFYIFRTS